MRINESPDLGPQLKTVDDEIIATPWNPQIGSVMHSEITALIPIVEKVARGFRGLGIVEYEDLVQAGCERLFLLADKYDPTRGITYYQYTAHHITNAMIDELRKCDFLSRGERNLLIGWQKLVAELEQKLGREPTIPELVEASGVNEEELSEIQSIFDKKAPVSLNAPLSNADHDSELELLDTVADPKAPTDDQLIYKISVSEIIEKAASLSPRISRVIDAILSGEEYVKVAEEFGVTGGAISQDIKKIRSAFAAEMEI